MKQIPPTTIAFAVGKTALPNLTHMIKAYRDNHNSLADAPHGSGVTHCAQQELDRLERQSKIADNALRLLTRCGNGEIERPLHMRTLWPATLKALELLVREIAHADATN